MTDNSLPEQAQQPDLAGLHERFPGFFPPDDEQIETFITCGLVAVDANALLDLYRLRDSAREEYLVALRRLGDRLWIPHRVGQEILERRLSVISECEAANDRLGADLGKNFDSVTQLLRTFGNRRGLSSSQVRELEELANQARDSIVELARQFYVFDLKFDKSIKGDAVLDQIVTLLEGKVGPPLDDPAATKAEALRRLNAEIPPGYKDWKKEQDRAISDCIIWFQLLHEAARRDSPVLLVTNEQKSDWLREDQGRKLGPRQELVAEMFTKSGVAFHLTSVQTFLLHAKKYLGVSVSESTVHQAEDLNREIAMQDVIPDVDILLAHPAMNDATSWSRRARDDILQARADLEESRRQVEITQSIVASLTDLASKEPGTSRQMEVIASRLKEARTDAEDARIIAAASKARYETVLRDFRFILTK